MIGRAELPPIAGPDREAEVISDAMQALPPELGRLLHAHFVDDVSLDELAAMAEVSIDAIRGLLHRANQELDALLARNPRWVALVDARERQVRALLAASPIAARARLGSR